jgi:hypothetical protein
MPSDRSSRMVPLGLKLTPSVQRRFGSFGGTFLFGCFGLRPLTKPSWHNCIKTVCKGRKNPTPNPAPLQPPMDPETLELSRLKTFLTRAHTSPLIYNSRAPPVPAPNEYANPWPTYSELSLPREPRALRQVLRLEETGQRVDVSAHNCTYWWFSQLLMLNHQSSS